MKDEYVKKYLIDELYWDSRVDASDVKAKVDQGEVVLEGTVPSYTAKIAADSAAWRIMGVKKVKNNLNVKYDGKIPSDNEIQKIIADKIAWNPNLNAFKIDVEVKDGTVTLKGTVDSYWKKMDAESEAQRVFGVFTVSNELGIAPTKNYLDEEIAKDIMRAIERKPTVPEDDVNVVVENGKVTLTGHVPSRLSSYAAMNAAIHTLGVKEVTNRMMVKK